MWKAEYSILFRYSIMQGKIFSYLVSTGNITYFVITTERLTMALCWRFSLGAYRGVLTMSADACTGRVIIRVVVVERAGNTLLLSLSNDLCNSRCKIRDRIPIIILYAAQYETHLKNYYSYIHETYIKVHTYIKMYNIKLRTEFYTEIRQSRPKVLTIAISLPFSGNS